MPEADRERFRQQLVELGSRLKGDVADLQREALREGGGTASGGLSNTPLHLADLGSDTYEQEVALSLLENEERALEEIAAALKRIDQGTFGRCENCQRDIAKERLQAIPFTRFCIECAEKLQKQAAP